ncbi:MAG: hypothetical protein HY909_00445 [Deltaproteobacteria bacterium]|nr:hypothetical protein [Deltaproteobacteria bacterium]
MASLRASWWALLGLGACAEDPPPAPPVVTLDTYDSALARAFCESVRRCGLSRPEEQLAAVLGTGEACERRLRPLFTVQLDDLAGLVRTGATRFDGVALERCVARIRVRCALGREFLENPCPEAFVGAQPDGTPCFRSEECLPGSFCQNGIPGVRRCGGVCRPRAPAGRQCSPEQLCVVGAVCDPPSGASARCHTLEYVTDASEGSMCGLVRGSDGTRRSVSCVAGAACSSRHGTGVCTAIGSKGTPCDARVTCGAGLQCLGSPPLCREVPILDTVGEPCDPSRVQNLCNPLERLQCIAGRCASLGDAQEGSACTGGDLSWRSCERGLACDRSSASCRQALPMGSACAVDGDCLSGDCSDTDPRVCLERLCR